MKAGYIILILSLYAISLRAQFGLETQIGGSNFLGISFNGFYDLSLTEDGRNIVSSTLGLGVLEPEFGNNFIILHGGVNYRPRRWGAGAEYSFFVAGLNETYTYDRFVDLLVYPNINYTVLARSGWVFKVSCGPYLAFSKDYRKSVGDVLTPYRFEGDVIPGAGLYFGYRF